MQNGFLFDWRTKIHAVDKLCLPVEERNIIINKDIIRRNMKSIAYLNKGTYSHINIASFNFCMLWVHTGDIGHIDKNGCVFIDGRIKRMIIKDGYKVFPAAIETTIIKYPNIKECAVVGIKDHALGFVAKAFLVLINGAEKEQTIEGVRNLCKENLYSYEVPDYFEVIDKLPLSNIGKIDYQKLERM